ncbi:unnamed protein product [Rotaria sp. Silwood1]|nr:unnamed protein product [Rotaria sp. Silwood1]CAF1551713.1 unnamed protein product [Rotaria sp. Silwood1]
MDDTNDYEENKITSDSGSGFSSQFNEKTSIEHEPWHHSILIENSPKVSEKNREYLGRKMSAAIKKVNDGSFNRTALAELTTGINEEKLLSSSSSPPPKASPLIQQQQSSSSLS